ncbi:MAG: holliday junction helicase RuvB, partial [Solirubrobacteraceae bacterium]
MREIAHASNPSANRSGRRPIRNESAQTPFPHRPGRAEREAKARVANRLLKRVRDWAEVRGTGVVDDAAADAALELLEVDELGLD